jgi:class 3 adenylate cyclase
VGAGDAGKEGGDDGRDDDDNEEMHEAVGHLIPEVTVVFVTVGSLCRLASRAPPVELVGLLNRLFGMMDDAASAHRVYKVMTTQDMWLGVAGALDDGGDHASRAARTALAIVKAVLRDGGHHRRHDGSQEDWSLGGERVQLQVGIHTGDVAAGVIGTRTPNWHIFGDTVRALAARRLRVVGGTPPADLMSLRSHATLHLPTCHPLAAQVNTASRMCTGGLPYRIQVTPATAAALAAEAAAVPAAFTLRPREATHFKGKGLMEPLWLADDELDALAAAAAAS